MAFQDRLLRASYNGIPIHVVADDAEFGRRTVTHVFPLRDRPWHEDLGLAVRALSVPALVIGDDADAQAARLEAELERPGPGTLVHPWYGELLVVPVGVQRVRHDRQRGRVVQFTLRFELAGEQPKPLKAADTAGAAIAAAKAVKVAAEGDFLGGLADLASAADHVVAEVAATVTAVADTVDAALKTYALVRSLPAAVVAELAALSADALALVAAPARLAAKMLAVPDALVRAAVAPVTAAIGGGATPATATMLAAAPAVAALALLTGDGIKRPAIAETTPSRRLQAAAERAVTVLARAGAAAAAATIAARATYEHAQAAYETRDRLAGALDRAADDAGSAGQDDGWRALTALRAAVIRDLTTRGGRLPALVRVRFAASRPSLALAQRLYGDRPDGLIDRAAEIAARNRAPHPGFLPGGTGLKVLAG